MGSDGLGLAFFVVLWFCWDSIMVVHSQTHLILLLSLLGATVLCRMSEMMALGRRARSTDTTATGTTVTVEARKE